MIHINDYDLPITVAQKIITGTKENNGETPLSKAVKDSFGIDIGRPDMFDLEEIGEIAAYLLQFYMIHKEIGD